jgi:hypothetical protein
MAATERSVAVPVIVLTGTMGSGKTTVVSEASDILAARGVIHAAIDFDTLGVARLPGDAASEVAWRNLASVWQNYARAGAERLLLAEALETGADLDRIRDAVPGSALVICRLRAGLETMQRRVALRDPGMLRDTFVARVAELDTLIDRAGLEHFCLSTEGCSVTEVARELLTRAGWI